MSEARGPGLVRRVRVGMGSVRRGPAVAMVVIVLLVALAWVAMGIRGVEGRAAETEPDVIRVAVMDVRARSIPFRPRYLATAGAFQTVEIRSRVRGFLNERLFREGGEVSAGDLMFRIDPKPFEAELAVARARRESAEARLSQAERQLERYRGLHERGAATTSELEEWETAAQVARADIELYQAQLVQAELDLGYTSIASPIDGVVGRALRDVGSFVDDGSNSLLAIVEQVDPIYVSFAMSERELLRTRRMRAEGRLTGPPVGEGEVLVTLRDGAEMAETGRVTFLDVSVDQATATVLLRATVPNAGGVLRPGQFVHVSLLGLERPGTVVVPKEAVVQTPASASVYVVTDDERGVEVRPVRLGEWYGTGWIVEEGLEDGETVVVDGIMRLRRDSVIEVRERLELDDFEVRPEPRETDPPAFHEDAGSED